MLLVLFVLLTIEAAFMKVGDFFNFKNQPERLIYLGLNWSGNGYWHQFALAEQPGIVWCEVLTKDLHMLERTVAPKVGVRLFGIIADITNWSDSEYSFLINIGFQCSQTAEGWLFYAE